MFDSDLLTANAKCWNRYYPQLITIATVHLKREIIILLNLLYHPSQFQSLRLYQFPLPNKLPPTECVKQHKYIILQFERSEFQNQFHWTKINLSAEICSFWSLPGGKSVFLTAFSFQKDCPRLGLCPPVTLTSVSVLTSSSLPLTFCLPFIRTFVIILDQPG